MKKNTSARKKLISIAIMQRKINNNGGVENNGETFEKCLAIQEKLLRIYNLPNNKEFNSILWFDACPFTKEVDKKIEALENASIEYLSRPSKTPLELLSDAKENKTDPFNIFPILGISTHIYTVFVYNRYLINSNEPVENILEYLLTVNKGRSLNTLGLLSQGEVINPLNRIKRLEKKGIKYIHQFLQAEKILRTDNDFFEIEERLNPIHNLLNDARQLNADAEEVLSLLQLQELDFAHFIYHEFLLKYRDTIENIAREFQILIYNPEIVKLIIALGNMNNRLDIYSQSEWGNPKAEITIDDENGQKHYKTSEILEMLTNNGLQYIDRYLLTKSNLVDMDDLE